MGIEKKENMDQQIAGEFTIIMTGDYYYFIKVPLWLIIYIYLYILTNCIASQCDWDIFIIIIIIITDRFT